MIGLQGLVVLTWVVAVQEDERAREEALKSQLKVSVSTVQEVFDRIDLLPLTVRYENVSKAPLSFTVFPAIPSFATITIEDPTGVAYQPHILNSPGCGPGHACSLQPGEYLEATSSWSLRYLLRSDTREKHAGPVITGEWKVRASFGRIESQIRRIRVVEDLTRPPEIRRLFGSDAWHRFVLRGGAKPENVEEFRNFVLSEVEAPQKDLMAHYVGVHDLNQDQPVPGAAMLRAGSACRVQNLARSANALTLVYCLMKSKKLAEALTELDLVTLDPNDFARRRWAELREGIVQKMARARR